MKHKPDARTFANLAGYAEWVTTEYCFPSYVRGEIEDVVQDVFDPKRWWVVTNVGRYLVEEGEVERVSP